MSNHGNHRYDKGARLQRRVLSTLVLLLSPSVVYAVAFITHCCIEHDLAPDWCGHLLKNVGIAVYLFLSLSYAFRGRLCTYCGTLAGRPNDPTSGSPGVMRLDANHDEQREQK